MSAADRLAALDPEWVGYNLTDEFVSLVRTVEYTVDRLNEYEAKVRALGLWNNAAADSRIVIVYHVRGTLLKELAVLDKGLAEPGGLG